MLINDHEIVATHIKSVSFHIQELNSLELLKSLELISDAYERKSSVYIGANGGSATMALHFATDWSKGLYESTGKGLKAMSLNSNVGINTAIANDRNYSETLSLPLEILGQKGDLLILISSSGISANIIKAAKTAREMGIQVIGISGFGITPLIDLSDVGLTINSTDMQVIEDCHSIFGHIVYKYFKFKFGST